MLWENHHFSEMIFLLCNKIDIVFKAHFVCFNRLTIFRNVRTVKLNVLYPKSGIYLYREKDEGHLPWSLNPRRQRRRLAQYTHMYIMVGVQRPQTLLGSSGRSINPFLPPPPPPPMIVWGHTRAHSPATRYTPIHYVPAGRPDCRSAGRPCHTS